MNRFSILLIFALFIAVISVSGSDKIQIKTLTLTAKTPTLSVLYLKNTGNEICKFNIKINNEFYYDIPDVIKKIKSTEFNKENLSEYQRAWAFIKNMKYSFDPFSKKNWTASLTIMLNSLGFGQSENIATCLYYLWTKLGYTAQLSTLGTYVVSEVKIKDKWELYDAAAGIYFKNEKKEIFSLNDIKGNADLIKTAIMPLYPASIFCNKYNDLITKIYEILNGQIITNVNQPYELTDSLHFFIPPGGKIEFGAIFDDSLRSEKGRTIPYYANLKLTIPKDWGGFINNPLVIQSIKGIGTAKIGSREYEINSKEFQNELTCDDEFIKYLNLTSLKTDLEIVYLINPKIARFKNENIIKLTGTNIDKLDIKINEIPDTMSVDFHLRKQTLFYHPDRIKLFTFDKIDSSVTITSTIDLYKKIDSYFDLKQDTERGSALKKKIKTIESKTLNQISESDIFKCLMAIPFEMFIYDIENTSIYDFFEKIKYFGKEK